MGVCSGEAQVRLLCRGQVVDRWWESRPWRDLPVLVHLASGPCPQSGTRASVGSSASGNPSAERVSGSKGREMIFRFRRRVPTVAELIRRAREAPCDPLPAPDPRGPVNGPGLVERTKAGQAAHEARYRDDDGFPVAFGPFCEGDLTHRGPVEVHRRSA